MATEYKMFLRYLPNADVLPRLEEEGSACRPVGANTPWSGYPHTSLVDEESATLTCLFPQQQCSCIETNSLKWTKCKNICSYFFLLFFFFLVIDVVKYRKLSFENRGNAPGSFIDVQTVLFDQIISCTKVNKGL